MRRLKSEVDDDNQIFRIAGSPELPTLNSRTTLQPALGIEEMSEAETSQPNHVWVNDRNKLPRIRTTALRHMVGRLFLVVAIMLIVALAMFVMVRLIPGDPARVVAGRNATAEQLSIVRAQLGLSGTFFEQLWAYLNNVIHLQFGTSFVTGQPVSQIILERLPFTSALVGASFLVVIVFGLVAGMTVASLTYGSRMRPLETTFGALSSFGVTMPSYLASAFLVYLLAVTLNLLPVAGSDGAIYLILPTLAVAIAPASGLSKVVKTETSNVLVSEYILVARSKNIPFIRIVLRHILPNVIGTSLATGGVFLASILSGTVVVETIFAWPGLGTALIQAVLNNDYPVVQGVVLVFTLLILTVNIVIDLIIKAVDPRQGGRRND